LNYQKIYNALVEKARVRGLDKSKHEGYFEIHHIIPRCLGGSDDKENLVMFTGREHFVAHMLLWKAFPENVSLMRAAHIMSSRWTNDISGNSHVGINSKVYSKLREEYSKAVSVQCSGENNPMFGVTHPPEILERIKATRKQTELKKRLVNWKLNNNKYMSQFEPREYVFQPFLLNVGSKFPVFRFKGEIQDWLSFEVYKNFWERSNKSGPKDFSTKIKRVSGRQFSGTYFKTMIERFSEGFDLSSDPDFIVKALNNNSDDYILELEKSLHKTLHDIEQEYISDWMNTREIKRNKIKDILYDLNIEKHKYNSKAVFSLIDVTEALILWRSGLVEQKFLANLYGVARNSVSNALETKERWLDVKKNIEQIEEAVFDRDNCTSQP